MNITGEVVVLVMGVGGGALYLISSYLENRMVARARCKRREDLYKFQLDWLNRTKR